MFGQMTAGSWIYIGTQGILQGTYQTFCAAGEAHFGSPDLERPDDPDRRASAAWAAPSRSPATMAGAAILCVEVDPSRIERRLATRYLDEAADDARRRARAGARGSCRAAAALGRRARQRGRRRSRSSRARGEQFDLVTDQTAAHDPLTGYVPAEVAVRGGGGASASAIPTRYLELARESIVAHVEGDARVRPAGRYVFDYGNNLRGEAHEAGLSGRLLIPGLRPGLYPAALLPRASGPSAGRRCRGPGRHRGDRRELTAALPRRRAAAAVARARAGDGSRSRGFRRGSAGSATATAPAPGSRSTSSCATGACRRRS